MDERPGMVTASFDGKGAARLFAAEGGGHRWQRTPPTERRGRVHTSTVTVAVLDADAPDARPLDSRDVEFAYARGSGPGGQHRNTTESCVIAKHRPTGEQVRIDLRSQHRSKAVALQVLAGRVRQREQGRAEAEQNGARRQQVGSGMRGDKVRTYRTQDNQVTDHRTNRKWRLDRWMRGEWQDLQP